MELKGILTPRGVISGSWLTFNGNYNKLTNKPTLNGVTIEGDKTSEDYHIESGGGGGGGGGTTDYNDLDNKPQINDVTLSGNKSLDALGIQAKISYPMDNTKYLDGEGNFTTPPSGGGDYEIITITGGDDTSSRTFTFDKTPKFVAYCWNDPYLENGWNTTSHFIWGQEYISYNSSTNQVAINNNYQGCMQATYVGSSVTLTGGNSFACCNSSTGSGYMFVIY